MAYSLIVEKASDAVLFNMFAAYFARKFFKEHEAEITSTSPYAVTGKIPKMRIVDNQIIKGSWHTAPVSSRVGRGFFGGIKSVRVSGGGGGGSIDTKVQFDHISMCPITGREFTDEELKEYHDDWWYRVSSYGKDQASKLVIESRIIDLSFVVRHESETFAFSKIDAIEIPYKNLRGDDLVEYVESHRE